MADTQGDANWCDTSGGRKAIFLPSNKNITSINIQGTAFQAKLTFSPRQYFQGSNLKQANKFSRTGNSLVVQFGHKTPTKRLMISLHRGVFALAGSFGESGETQTRGDEL